MTGPIVDPVLINRTISFSSGQFAGETIRYELKEIQKACLGRKYARVDRRPLDPPPVVLMHLWRSCPETGREEEVDYEEVQTHGLLCTVDLFPVPAKSSKDSSPSSTAAKPRTPKRRQTNDGFVHFSPSGPSPSPSSSPSPPYRPQSYGPSDIVHYYDGTYPLLERSKTTHALVGATFVQPVLVELSGKKCIVFVFSDLAVKLEGTFTLRYRVFDLFSPSPNIRESPSGEYPTTPSPLSISPIPSPTSVSGCSYTPSSNPQSSLSTSPSQQRFHHTHSPSLQPHLQSRSSQHSSQSSLNPYSDSSQDFTTSPQQSLRRLQEPEENLDNQAVFAPYEVQTRIEPRGRDASLGILGECWAKGSFRIFSTKEFPGLPASTELTKQLARWGVRLNIRETERRRRRKSDLMDEPEEERQSDVEGIALARDQQLQQQRATNIKPGPPPAQKIHYRADYRSSPSTSPTQPPPQRRILPPSPTLVRAHDRHNVRQDSEGDDDYEEKYMRRHNIGHSPDAMDYEDNTGNYNHTAAQLASRSSSDSEMPAYHSLAYSSASSALGPAPSASPTLHSLTNPSHVRYHYDISTHSHMHGVPFVPSGVRSSVNGVGLSESTQNPSTNTGLLSRYENATKRRYSEGGSSNASMRSAESHRSEGEFRRMAPSFMYGVGGGVHGGSQS